MMKNNSFKLTHIDLEVTRKCNLNCIHCSASSRTRGQTMSLSVLKNVLSDAKSMGVEKIGLTGGEPFLDLETLTAVGDFCTKTLSIPIHIHSNGTQITRQNADWVREVEAEITIALYGPNSEVHDVLTRTTGSFSSTMRGLQNLIDAKANVCVYIVPMQQNIHSIILLIDQVYNMGVRHVRVLSLAPTGRAKAQFENLELTKKDAEHLNRDLLKIKEKTNIDLTTGFCTSQDLAGLSILKGHEECFAAENRIHIDCFGNVFPCTASSGRIMLSAGNLTDPENNLETIWTQSPMLQFFRYFHRNPPRGCIGCNKHSICMSGCRVRMSYKFGDITISNPECGGPYKLPKTTK
jgi:radical SAM protein with 4Fe4S-binding SPASM domain